LLLQHLNTHQSSYITPYSFPAFNFPTNFVGQPRFQQFPKFSLSQLEMSNQSSRFVKIPLNTVETARKFSPSRFVTPPLTLTPPSVSISTHIAEIPLSSSGNTQSNIMSISSMIELSCDDENKAKTFKESNEKQE